MQRWIFCFIAGFLAVFCFHQPALGLLHSAGVVPFAPFSLAATQPLGVPSVVSAGFWGGLWAIVMMLVLNRLGSSLIWLKAALFGGIALTAVAVLVVFPLKGYGLDMAQLPGRFIIGFILNACWGIGTIVFIRVLPH
ncbi:MAG: hypothetical protein CVV07_03520 [Gammaproteobacteria bacterium HGW-Gammaproteobacteria-11]|nr:MAG: hypothetical protein CVV07_03520 [Gammaproteobacteria bacterium HGW-Gammaproteobacteria-11]